jgi:pimeloyl-ACP methyl ester carboxylesterase
MRPAFPKGSGSHFSDEREGARISASSDEPQIPACAAAGLRVIAVDMRGYNRSSRLSGVEPYQNYYRALIRGARRSLGLLGPQIEQPVLVLWGEQDRYLSHLTRSEKPRPGKD